MRLRQSNSAAELGPEPENVVVICDSLEYIHIGSGCGVLVI
jgi:hypothetical protein